MRSRLRAWRQATQQLFQLPDALLGQPTRFRLGPPLHLGGLAFGFLYAKFQWRLASVLDRAPQMPRQRRAPRLRVVRAEEPTDDEPNRMDELLKKISERGQASLTAEEQEYLKRESERLKRRRL